MSQETDQKILNSGKNIRILVAAGASGGHIFPALQVMQALSESLGIPAGRLKIEFVCSTKLIDQQIYQKSGYVFHQYGFKGVKGQGLKGYLNFLRALPGLVSEINSLLNSFKPDLVAGFGGFPSVIPVLAACIKGIPSWIHESDQKAGLANKFLSLFARDISSSFDNVRFPTGRKSLYSGHPIRSDLIPFTLGADNFNPENILIIGGSQASKSLDLTVPKVICALSKQKRLNVYHQARAENVSEVQKIYDVSGVEARVEPFFNDMLSAYNWADVIISRAGSGAVAELAVLNKPVIFVPIPNVSGHQLQNARWLASFDKALIIEEGDNFRSCLEDALARLLEPEVYKRMVSKDFAQRRTGSAAFLARQIYSAINS